MALEVQAHPVSIFLNPYFLGLVSLALVVYGVVLFIKSKQVPSKSLRVGILLPLITFILGLVWILGDIMGVLDSGGYFLFGMLGGWLLASVVSVIFSVVALNKIDRKSLAWGSIVYGLVLFLVWLVSVLNFDGM